MQVMLDTNILISAALFPNGVACRDRVKGKKGNGCKNTIVSEDDLLEALSDALGLEWNGADNVDENDFESLKAVKIFDVNLMQSW